MLKKPASSVLASLRGSAYAKKVRLVPSLAAALPDGLFEHPAIYSVLVCGLCSGVGRSVSTDREGPALG
jgi:hypothetical protein